jgi:hypothetical protein
MGGVWQGINERGKIRAGERTMSGEMLSAHLRRV